MDLFPTFATNEIREGDIVVIENGRATSIGPASARDEHEAFREWAEKRAWDYWMHGARLTSSPGWSNVADVAEALARTKDEACRGRG